MASPLAKIALRAGDAYTKNSSGLGQPPRALAPLSDMGTLAALQPLGDFEAFTPKTPSSFEALATTMPGAGSFAVRPGLLTPSQSSGQGVGPQYGMAKFNDRSRFGIGAPGGGFGFKAQMAQWSQPLETPGMGTGALDGGGASLGGDWSGVDRWNREIEQARRDVFAKTGVSVPTNVIKAIMKIESDGQHLPANYAGYVGLMQVGPGSWGVGTDWDLTRATNDPAYNIFAGTMELARRYNDAMSQNPNYDWSNVATGYFSGHYEPNGASDRWNSDYNYKKMFTDYWTQLEAGGATTGGVIPGGSPVPAGTNGFTAITGGQSYPITQELGGNAMDYSNYDYTLGVSGHPGLDIGMPLGTPTYTPVAGTVITAGGTPYFTDQRYGATPGMGELRIQLDNGDQMVFGHTQKINVQVGQRVTPGMLVAESGTYNGPHIHLEYLRAGANTQSGFQAVDPRQALGGAFTGSLGGGMTQQPGVKNSGGLNIRAPLGRQRYAGSTGAMTGAAQYNTGFSTVQPLGRQRW